LLVKQPPEEKKLETLKGPFFWGEQKLMILKIRILIILGTFLTSIKNNSGH
jgi:hypothetical protein